MTVTPCILIENINFATRSVHSLLAVLECERVILFIFDILKVPKNYIMFCEQKLWCPTVCVSKVRLDVHHPTLRFC